MKLNRLLWKKNICEIFKKIVIEVIQKNLKVYKKIIAKRIFNYFSYVYLFLVKYGSFFNHSFDQVPEV